YVLGGTSCEPPESIQEDAAAISPERPLSGFNADQTRYCQKWRFCPRARNANTGLGLQRAHSALLQHAKPNAGHTAWHDPRPPCLPYPQAQWLAPAEAR